MLHKDLPFLNTPQGCSKGPIIPRKDPELLFIRVVEGFRNFKKSLEAFLVSGNEPGSPLTSRDY